MPKREAVTAEVGSLMRFIDGSCDGLFAGLFVVGRFGSDLIYSSDGETVGVDDGDIM